MIEPSKFPQERHESQRGYFAAELYELMAQDERIWLISADLGYKVFDYHFRDFPERTINTGAAEMAAMGICVGLALEKKIPIFYSITPFSLWRPAEVIRNYIDHEQVPVIIIGSGRNRDYERDGWSHDGSDDKQLMAIFKNINSFWTETKEEIGELLSTVIESGKPTYINLTR